ncbi:hypothetical protein HU200_033377 [Digitaria exilis]|uniref:Uncharacterized protein n=1 Tax=Digitaria exilis TaxID=1010633 RepID=A0A835BVQ3_9POAL|nr:hypothetical protein HU200_033377 [Digitaria exilis]
MDCSADTGHLTAAVPGRAALGPYTTLGPSSNEPHAHINPTSIDVPSYEAVGPSERALPPTLSRLPKRTGALQARVVAAPRERAPPPALCRPLPAPPWSLAPTPLLPTTGAHLCPVGSSVSETLNRHESWVPGPLAPTRYTKALRDLAPTLHNSKPPLPPFFLPLLSSFLSSARSRKLPRTATGASFAAPCTCAAPSTAALLQGASPHCECGKPAQVTQSMHPETAARVYYKCGDYRAFLCDQLCEVPAVDPSST